MKKILFLLVFLFTGTCFADRGVEFLIYSAPSTYGNEYGDLIIVKDYGSPWGKEELNNDKFFRLWVVDMNLEEAITYIGLYYLDIDNLPTGIKNTLLYEGEYAMMKSTFLEYSIKK